MGGAFARAVCEPFSLRNGKPHLCVLLTRLQAVGRQGADAICVRLGSVLGPLQAQLGGFKSRALRKEALSHYHLYLTEWHLLDVVTKHRGGVLVVANESFAASFTRPSLWTSGDELAAKLGSSMCMAQGVAIATAREYHSRSPLDVLEVAVVLVQTQAATAPMINVWLLTDGNPADAGSVGFARSVRAEASLPVCCIDRAATTALEHLPMLSEPEVALCSAALDVLVPRLSRARQWAHVTTGSLASVHVVAGGTGGLGLLTARWLTQHQAVSTLALASRSGLLARDAASEGAGLRTTNVSTLVQRCDTAEDAHIGRLVANAMGIAPTTSVWHAAGVLADGVLPRQRAETCARVYAPKAYGAWALHSACGTAVVPTYAPFSSVAAAFGGAGQANYSAANACLDALATWRRSCALAATSVQWGAWAEVGMATRGAAAERMAAMEAASGIGRIGLGQGLGALHTAVRPQAHSLVAVMPVQWERMLSDGAVPAFLSNMVVSAPTMQHKSAVPAEQRTRCAISLEAVLKMGSQTAGTAIDADAPLMEAGIDSLGAVELRNQLQRAVGDGVALSSTLVFDYPTARLLQASLQYSEDMPPISTIQLRALAEVMVSANSVILQGSSNILPASCFGAASLWHAARTSGELVGPAPFDRWGELFNSDGELVPQDGAFIDAPELFDAGLFKISPAEARVMDLQQRLVLEHSYCSIHSAGHNRTAIRGQAVGVYIGIWAEAGWSRILDKSEHAYSAHRISATSCSMAAGRVSYTLELRGPALSVRRS